MNGGLIAKRYGAALEQYAAECSLQGECYRDARALLAVMPRLREYLRAPHPAAEKMALLEKAVPDACPAFHRFLQVVTSHRREYRLTTILQSYIALYKKSRGIVTARLTVASPPSEALLKKLEALTLEKSGAKSVEIDVEVNPTIIGGFIYKVEDRRTDASVLRQINDLKKAFEFNNTKRLI